MGSDGKQLEELVAFVEKTLLPQGFEVKTNSRVFNDEGVQIAEFDIDIKGRVGTTDFHWLIECRDRPGSGAAPASWIEQLVGRRDRFGWNKVTAVSTTGFAQPAIEYAQDAGIEIREVESLEPKEFQDWILIKSMPFYHNQSNLTHASLRIGDDEPHERLEALKKVVGITAPKGDKVLGPVHI